MSHVAFYAPLKSPEHPTPSGDRQIARNLMTALERALNRPVTLASELRSFEPEGSTAAQQDISKIAHSEIARLLESKTAPAIWVSYHNYYKAPDLIGPEVSRAWNIPYVLIEATRASSRLTGPWEAFAHAAEAACNSADVIFHFTENDRFALARDRVGDQQIVELPPFLNRETLPLAGTCAGPMLAVGMMRHKDKLASYALIADALDFLKTPDWRLDVVGDGPARAEVEAMFTRFGSRIRFLGALGQDVLQMTYGTAGQFVWPGVNEAFGMVYLEAQAAGLPVVAQNRAGVRDVLVPGSYPDPDQGAAALAVRMDALLSDPCLRQREGERARRYIQDRHLLPAAAGTLRSTLQPLIGHSA